MVIFFADTLTSRISYDSLAGFSYYYIDDVIVSIDSGFVNTIARDISRSVIKIFPNPANDWLMIEGENASVILIYDVFGKLVFTDEVFSSPSRLNVSDFKKGIYFIELLKSNESIKYKIVIN